VYLIVEKGKRERVLARLMISLCSNQKKATVASEVNATSEEND
jgi:hypothetical protein